MNDIIFPGIKPKVVKKVAKCVLPSLFRACNYRLIPYFGNKAVDEKLLMQTVVHTIDDAFKTYGYLTKGYLVETVTKTCPYFAEVADNFITRVTETAQLAIELDSKQYEAVLEYILSNPEVPHEQKLRECRELLKQKNQEKMMERVILCQTLLIIVGTVVVGYVECRRMSEDAGVEKTRIEADAGIKKTKIEAEAGVEKTRIAAETAKQMHETTLSPLDKIVDTLIVNPAGDVQKVLKSFFKI